MGSTENQHPEQQARDRIDRMLEMAGWKIQSMGKMNLTAGVGVAVREYPTATGPADYVLFLNGKPVGIIEAKQEKEGHRLTVHEDQSGGYAGAKLKYLDNAPLPFVYESTGIITRLTDNRDPHPRAREVFSFHRPETMVKWLTKEKSLRARLQDFPELRPEGLWKAQFEAINNLEQSFKGDKPRALVQMATGAGKTFAAVTSVYRLLKHADAKRILFLVDTRNLGEQAEQEFMKFQPTDDNRKFTELYNVQRLTSSYIAPDSHVCISTIQRMYSILQGKELDPSAEEENPNESTWLESQKQKKEPLPVAYSEELPLEQFDFIFIDECHRSIYNLWQQVLDYFDAFLIGLTATPAKHTFAFFNQNLVSEYSYEESVTDGVNVPYEVYNIVTEVSQNGGLIEAGWNIERRDKLTRKKRWQQEDEDIDYHRNDLDRRVVNHNQIRTIIREFRKALKRDLFPRRINEEGDYEVPKTLIFAKTDSHADDIIRIVREEFEESNQFCKKLTYRTEENPKTVLGNFRIQYYPRIAVTVDMIATGTDIRPLEVLLFMRDVRSVNYFEQMKGRGTRTIGKDELRLVSSTADSKSHFVLVDAVGVTRSKKTDSRPLERKPTVALKDLLGAVTAGANDEDLFLSLANRLLKLDRQLTDTEKERLEEKIEGRNLRQMSKQLLDAHDPDTIEAEAEKLKKAEDLPSMELAREKAKEQLAAKAASNFNGELNTFIEDLRRQHEQLIDHLNVDTVLRSEWDTDSADKAQETVQQFADYLKANREELTALGIYYDQPYRRREVTFKMVKEVLEKLKMDRPQLAPLHVWEAYAHLETLKGQRPESELTALVSLIRRVCGLDEQLTPYRSTVDKNFQRWVFGKQAGALKFDEAQMEWLHLLKEHVISSFHVELDDLDFTPFNAKGGRGRMYQLFGDDVERVLEELNEELVA